MENVRRFDFNVVEKGAASERARRARPLWILRHSDASARGSRHRRIHFVEFSFLGSFSLSLPASLSLSSSLFLPGYPSLSISFARLPLVSINSMRTTLIYTYTYCRVYTARRTPKRENSVSTVRIIRMHVTRARARRENRIAETVRRRRERDEGGGYVLTVCT